jgi:hypothetical protein
MPEKTTKNAFTTVDTYNERPAPVYPFDQRTPGYYDCWTDPCPFPSKGWYCTRGWGHTGPCAAKPRWWKRLQLWWCGFSTARS